ncbi:transporter substrate-binding domain-containing protein [Thalassospira sp.]|uniref:transporter substrate-binding domain-containing protein n=1 Tax=Thalassospira sp. TaxID=1912094 RepID=UPI0027338C76|nr:transporter substrate-binding domain-containing protein [Thalassospira sp.]MDP2697913.1 transporter substrate-binding domain-containing protein [Thalassospira sp.]
MKNWIKVAAVAAVGFAISASAAQAAWEKVVIATEGAYPPFNSVDKDGNLEGFDVDFAVKLCETAGIECEIVAQDWDGIIPGLLAKKYDAIIAQMSITEERKRSIDFSDYYSVTPAVFVGKDGMEVTAWKDDAVVEDALDGLVVGVQRSTTHSNFLEDNFPSVEIRMYDTQDNALLDLTAGRIDVTLADSGVLLDWVESDAGAGYSFVSETFAPVEFFGEGAGIGLRKEDQDLKEILNKALAEMLANGSYAEINKKYFPTINLHPR